MAASSPKPLSRAAAEALAAYPWPSARARRKAEAEASLVAFGDAIELDDLPLEVRRFARQRKVRLSFAEAFARVEWRGESWDDLRAAFERTVLAQALRRANGNENEAARLLKTTPRIVRYRRARLGRGEDPKNADL